MNYPMNETYYELPHLFWARILFDHIGKGITYYEHSTGPVVWGPYDKQQLYQCITDCSGLVNALIKKAYSVSFLNVLRPYASTYYHAILNQNHFIYIKQIQQALAGK